MSEYRCRGFKYQPEGDFADAHLVFAGGLQRDKLVKLEHVLKITPSDVKTRLALLGHYLHQLYAVKGSKKLTAELMYVEHMQAMVNNHPRHVLHANFTGVIEDKHFPQLSLNWEIQLSENSDDVTILCHAARFFEFNNSLYCAKLLKRASKLDESNDLFPHRLSRLYSRLFEISTDAGQKRFAKLSITELRAAVGRYEKYVSVSKRALYTYKYDIEAEEVAQMAISCGLYKEAKGVANLILSRAVNLQVHDLLPRVKDGCAYGIISSVNKGNAILGYLAIAENNTALALNHFERLLVIEPYTHIESDFATALLRAGEREAVVKYIKSVRELFRAQVKSGKAQLKTSPLFEQKQSYAKQRIRKLGSWIREIEQGRSPTLSYS